MRRRTLIAIGLAVVTVWFWPSGQDPEPNQKQDAPNKPVVSVRSDATPSTGHSRIRHTLPPPDPRRAPPQSRGEQDVFEDTGLGEDTAAEPSPPMVRAQLVDSDGQEIDQGMVYSPDCDIWIPVLSDGTARFFLPEGQPCLLQGRRQDGLLWGRSEWLELELYPGDVVDIELVIPTERTGGLGVQFAVDEEGFRVVRVWPGTPAAEMGLRTGDIITAVDGLPAVALTSDEFIEVITGPVGTDVEFELSYDADTGYTIDQMTLTRAWLSG